MTRYLLIAAAIAAAVSLMIAAMWAWASAGALSIDATRPEVQRWAVRSAAIGTVALAQLLLLTFVVGRMYERRPGERRGTDLIRATAGLVAGVALVSAAALGLAGGLAGS